MTIWKNIQCDFKLHLYPFDYQICYINFTFPTVKISHFNFNGVKKVTNYQPESLCPTEYFISDIGMKNYSQQISITFKLNRYVYFYLHMTYFPIILLHLIGYGTLFIRDDDFQNRGTLSLTSLLVLISLYSDSLKHLPATSYVKAYDYWFIFSIFFISAIIAIHLLTNNTMNNGFYFFCFKNRPIIVLKNIQILKSARYILAIGYVLFQVIHWSLVFVAIQ